MFFSFDEEKQMKKALIGRKRPQLRCVVFSLFSFASFSPPVPSRYYAVESQHLVRQKT